MSWGAPSTLITPRPQDLSPSTPLPVISVMLWPASSLASSLHVLDGPDYHEP